MLQLRSVDLSHIQYAAQSELAMDTTFYELMTRQGVSRRNFLKFCTLTATSLGLGPSAIPQIVHALETKPRTPVLWLHGLE
jgi:hydrogenase small subunit